MKKNKKIALVQLIPVFFLLAALSGCGVRSISDSGYRAEHRGNAGASNPFYSGELSELAVLGIDPGVEASQEEISRSLAGKQKLVVPKGSSLMLVQSGALMPDEEMLRALEQYYDVAAFSGVPAGRDGGNYATALRLAAAKGGCDTIMVYWGILETARKSKGTKVLSWMPFVGGMIPDEAQEMRIRLKVAFIDVKTGQWEAFSPRPFQDTEVSTRYSREVADQGQVAGLKASAYVDAVDTMVKKYAK